MGRLLGGFALLAVALFMVVGFLRADVDQAALRTMFALLIGAGLPAAGGSWLLARHFGIGRRIDRRREELRRDTLEAEILKMAERHGGRLTAVEVAGELAVPATTAEELLNELMRRELAEIEITDSGLLVYAFHDLRHLSENVVRVGRSPRNRFPAKRGRGKPAPRRGGIAALRVSRRGARQDGGTSRRPTT